VEKEKKRERSVAYPYASWGDCLDFIKLVDAFRASHVSYDEAAKKCGVSTNTISFKAKLSSSRQFGLIETTGNVISLTSNAKRLLYPTGNDEPQIIFECFANPPLYSKLVGIYNGKALPTEVVLSNVILNDYSIARNAKDTAAQFFIQNAIEMGFVRAGVLDYSLRKSENATNGVPDNPPISLGEGEERFEPVPADGVGTQSVTAASESDYIAQIIPTESGKVARIIIPVDATEDDLWLIRDTLDVIMKRRFKIILE